MNMHMQTRHYTQKMGTDRKGDRREKEGGREGWREQGKKEGRKSGEEWEGGG